MDTPEVFLIIALGLGAGALSKGVTGMGLPLFALPVLASFFELAHAIAIMAVPIVATNAWQIWHYRGHAGAVDFLPRMVLGGFVGVCLGTLFLKTAPGAVLQVAFGAMLLAYVALRLAHPSLLLPMTTARRIGLPTSLAAGALQGAVGMAGPIVLTFLNALRLERGSFIFTISVIYLSYAVMQVAALAVAGLLTGETLVQGAFALVPVALVMPLGVVLGRHISAAAFDRVVLLLLSLIALRFVARGLGLV